MLSRRSGGPIKRSSRCSSRSEQIRVPWWISQCTPSTELEVHEFADVSENAYAAVVYLRSKQGQAWSVTLLAAKTKVAPVKQVSLPRLELSAATLLARLTSRLQSVFSISRVPHHLWSDSTVALGWIKSHPSRWHHIPGRENPADCASRGLSPSELVDHELWWQGPSWLKGTCLGWPTVDGLLEEMLPERRAKAHATGATPTEPEELFRFSSLSRLLRVTAWC